MPSDMFMWFIVFWSVLITGFLFIGGYFMFRKFLKSMPKEDGKSTLDWQDYYIDKTIHLWPQDKKDLLEELVSPVPEIFRDTAREKIAGKVGELALKEKAQEIDEDLLIRGYIIATPKRDHKFLRKKLIEKNIDFSTYEHLFN
ncbi:DUF2621 family protein [Alteribacillus iranensis]|uniref:DUF2621 domain-containing protein n=1 Tax=Alteribacillus iranensis TaxID=930128 RepID=A0A1I2A0D3_9BACI|nr:DUF2621 family protein [Alteribacillus iranensis]SFE37296.1 Protein of unknown function [Alteribacillus iranensis]